MSFEPDSARRVYDGSLLGLTVERWGEHEREIVEHPGAVAVVAVDGEGSVSLVRQLREPARKRLLELPAGTAEPGEEPLETARRELEEECGLTGGEWRELAAFWTTPGFCRERMHLFAAEGSTSGRLHTGQVRASRPSEQPPPRVGCFPSALAIDATVGIVVEQCLVVAGRWQVPRDFVVLRRGDSVSPLCASAFRKRSRPTSTAWHSHPRARVS